MFIESQRESQQVRVISATALVGAVAACALICWAADAWLHHETIPAITRAVAALLAFAAAQLGQPFFERVYASYSRTDARSESMWKQDLYYFRYLCRTAHVPARYFVVACMIPFLILIFRAVFFLFH